MTITNGKGKESGKMTYVVSNSQNENIQLNINSSSPKQVTQSQQKGDFFQILSETKTQK